MESKRSRELQQRLHELQAIFAQQLPGRLDALHRIWQQLQQGWDNEELARLHHLCHSLAGSGGSFGAHEIGNAARALEQQLKIQLAELNSPDAKTLRQLQQLLDELCECANRWRASGSHQP